MSDLDELIRDVLVAKAEPVRLPADTASLARFRAHRSRRRLQWASVGAAAVVAVVAVGAVVVVQSQQRGAASPAVGSASSAHPQPSEAHPKPSSAVPCLSSVRVDGIQVWDQPINHWIHLRVGQTLDVRVSDAPAAKSPQCSLAFPTVHEGLSGPRTIAPGDYRYKAVGRGRSALMGSWDSCPGGLCPFIPAWTYTIVVDG